MRVLKFGGTSVADGERVGRVADLVAEAAGRERVVVVVSALAGVTDALAAAADRTASGNTGSALVASLRARHAACLRSAARRRDTASFETAMEARLTELRRTLMVASHHSGCPPPLRDRVLATGERLSVLVLAAALQARGLSPDVVDGGEVIVTDSAFGEAEVDPRRTARVAASRLGRPGPGTIPVVTGFIGADSRARTTTLGRGGSDYTASLLGAALAAECVEIWTDVDGVLSAPPRLVSEAQTVPRLDYLEATEVARLGGKVLHPKTMRPLAEAGIPILVRNTFAPQHPGTWIGGRDGEGGAKPKVVAAVENAALFALDGPGHSRARRALGTLRSDPLVVAQRGGTLNVVLGLADADRLEDALRRAHLGQPAHSRTAAGVVAVVGDRHPADTPGRFEALLKRANAAPMMVHRTSPRVVCAVVEPGEVARLTRFLHRELVSVGDPAEAVTSPFPSAGRPERPTRAAEAR